MAVSFRLLDGSATDLLGPDRAALPGARPPEDFLELIEASASPVTAAALPRAAPRRACRPLVASARAKALVRRSPTPRRLLPDPCLRVDRAQAAETWVRYRLLAAARPGRGPTDFEGPDRLREEIVARLAAHPARYTLEVQRRRPGRRPARPDVGVDRRRVLRRRH